MRLETFRTFWIARSKGFVPLISDFEFHFEEATQALYYGIFIHFNLRCLTQKFFWTMISVIISYYIIRSRPNPRPRPARTETFLDRTDRNREYPRPRPARTNTSLSWTDRRPKRRPRSVSVGPNSGRSGWAARELARPEPTLIFPQELAFPSVH